METETRTAAPSCPNPLTGVTLSGRVHGPLCELTLAWAFSNQESASVELIHHFLLPAGAVLLGLSCRIGDRKLQGQVADNRAAAATYEETLEKGQAAVLLEHAEDGHYTLSLGNLGRGQNATVACRFAQLLLCRHGLLRVAVPTVIAPRYGDPQQGSLGPHHKPAYSSDVEVPLQLDLSVSPAAGAGTITSPSHKIVLSALAQATRVQLADAALAERDLVLEIRADVGRMAVWGRDAGQAVVLAGFMPEIAPTARSPLTLKVLVDCSGSMEGSSMDAARCALLHLLDCMAGEDRFTLSRFGSTTDHYSAVMQGVGSRELRHARAWSRGLRADLGGTEMASALDQTSRIAGAEPADILLITDGQI